MLLDRVLSEIIIMYIHFSYIVDSIPKNAAIFDSATGLKGKPIEGENLLAILYWVPEPEKSRILHESRRKNLYILFYPEFSESIRDDPFEKALLSLKRACFMDVTEDFSAGPAPLIGMGLVLVTLSKNVPDMLSVGVLAHLALHYHEWFLFSLGIIMLYARVRDISNALPKIRYLSYMWYTFFDNADSRLPLERLQKDLGEVYLALYARIKTVSRDQINEAFHDFFNNADYQFINQKQLPASGKKPLQKRVYPDRTMQEQNMPAFLRETDKTSLQKEFIRKVIKNISFWIQKIEGIKFTNQYNASLHTMVTGSAKTFVKQMQDMKNRQQYLAELQLTGDYLVHPQDLHHLKNYPELLDYLKTKDKISLQSISPENFSNILLLLEEISVRMTRFREIITELQTAIYRTLYNSQEPLQNDRQPASPVMSFEPSLMLPKTRMLTAEIKQTPPKKILAISPGSNTKAPVKIKTPEVTLFKASWSRTGEALMKEPLLHYIWELLLDMENVMKDPLRPILHPMASHYLLIKCSDLISHLTHPKMGYKTILCPVSLSLDMWHLRNNLVHNLSSFKGLADGKLLQTFYAIFHPLFQELRNHGATHNFLDISALKAIAEQGQQAEKRSIPGCIAEIKALTLEAHSLHDFVCRAEEKQQFPQDNLLQCNILSLLLRFREPLRFLKQNAREKYSELRRYFNEFEITANHIAHAILDDENEQAVPGRQYYSGYECTPYELKGKIHAVNIKRREIIDCCDEYLQSLNPVQIS